jgi:hypothetical protein
MPYMGSLLIFHPLLRKAWNKFNPIPERSQGGRYRLDQRASFDFLFAFIFLFALHGLGLQDLLHPLDQLSAGDQAPSTIYSRCYLDLQHFDPVCQRIDRGMEIPCPVQLHLTPSHGLV